MKIHSAEFVTSATDVGHYPPGNLPEIAFVGRSNVGKSSLINTLVNRRRLVKTSNTPGRTQLVNFFVINNQLMMVDLPGYGYAKVPKAVQRNWRPMVESYFKNRSNLMLAVLLQDIRRDIRDEERQLFAWFQQQGILCQPVITKADKLSKNQQQSRMAQFRRQPLGPNTEWVLFSSKTRLGVDVLWERVLAAIGSDTGEQS